MNVPTSDLSSILRTSAPPRMARAVLMPSTSIVTAALAHDDVDLGATQAVAACGRAVVVDTARSETSIILSMVRRWCCARGGAEAAVEVALQGPDRLDIRRCKPPLFLYGIFRSRIGGAGGPTDMTGIDDQTIAPSTPTPPHVGVPISYLTAAHTAAHTEA